MVYSRKGVGSLERASAIGRPFLFAKFRIMNTESYIIVFLFVFTIIILNVIKEVITKKEKKKRVTLKYNTVNSFMNKTEKEFFNILSNAVQDQYHVFSKVRILDIFTIPKYLEYGHKQTLKNYVQSKHVDFLLCEKDTLKPIIAIELDGKSHLNQKRKERDELVDQVFESANMRLVHVPVTSTYNIAEILQQPVIQ
jgi:uncharacterized protein DUF2726